MLKVVVMGYGIIKKEYRTDEEWSGLQIYYKKLGDLIKELLREEKKDFNFSNKDEILVKIIFTGGYSKTNPKISEAETAKQYYLSQVSRGFTSNVFTLTNPRGESTLENIVNTYVDHIDTWDNIIIVCDQVRRFRTMMTVKILGIRAKVVGLPRPDPHPKSTPVRQFFGLLLDIFTGKIAKAKKLLK
ncbi:MAG: ElyC/SanA/YdcF family protein [Patescibacteria group bacterium]